MPFTDSPLRYPGGKTQLAPFVIDLLKTNDLFYGHYVEPYAGGCGIAWRLLLNSYVAHAHINDIDPAIHAFWYCALYRTDELCDRIRSANVTVANWRRQRAVQKRTRAAQMDLAFSTFFLNRTNRSGIMDGGVIGGYSQKGKYTVDCRFNKDDLIKKIRRIGGQRERVSLSRLDALDFLRLKLKQVPKLSLVNLDPPYYKNGRALYANHYRAKDHAALARAIPSIKQRWMVTYDDVPETRTLYKKYPCYGNELYYSAQTKRTGVELLVLDPRLEVPAALIRQAKRQMKSSKVRQ